MTTSADVPGLLPCAINGHAYLCEAEYQRQTVPVMRQQADTSTEAGEQSLNPQGLWRRSQESWHHGAGQDFLDGRQGDSPTDSHRFRSSKGIDVWTKGQISLLHPTLKIWSTTNTNLFLAAAQDLASIFYLYVADGSELYWNPVPYNEVNSFALQTGTGWTPTNATIAASGLGFEMTATGAGAVSATSPTGTSGLPADAYRTYSVAFASLYVSGGGAKTPTVAVNWYDATGVFISTSTAITGGASTDGGGGLVIYGTATAPATAAYASLTIGYTTDWAPGEIHRETAVSFGPSAAVTPFPSAERWSTANIQAGEAAQPIQSLATNGSYVWAALGTSGLHRTFAGGVASTANKPAAPVGGQISLVGWANGFLLAAGSSVTTTGRNTLWLVSDPLGTPALSLIKTHADPNFKWEGIGHGRNCVYAWGNSGAQGEVYKILFDPNTGSLSGAASFATYLPDGESIHALQFYAGGIIMGTGKGVRIGSADGAGNIDYGPLIATDWPVRCLEPQDRYCWFGWTKYDDTNSGLGRIDLGFLTDTLTPAWASDLMTPDTTSGDVVSCITFEPYGYTANQRPPVRAFTVAGQGVYLEDVTSRASAGNLETGAIRFSTSEPKYAKTVDLMYHVSTESSGFLEVDYRVNDGSYVDISLTGSAIASGGTAFDVGSIGEGIEIRVRLRPGFSVPLGRKTSLDVTRWTLKALPLPTTIDETFVLTLVMKEYIMTSSGKKQYQDVPAEVAFLKALERSRTIIEFQVGGETHEGYVAQSQWTGTNWNNPKREFAEGNLQIQLQTVRG